MAEQKLSSDSLKDQSLAMAPNPDENDEYGPKILEFKVVDPPLAGSTLSYSLLLEKEKVGTKSPGITVNAGVRLDFNICLPDGTVFQVLDAGKQVLASKTVQLSFPKECISAVNLPFPDFPTSLFYYINIISPNLDTNKLHQIGGTGLIVIANVNGGGGNNMGLVGNRLSIGTLPPNGTILGQYANAVAEELNEKFSPDSL